MQFPCCAVPAGAESTNGLDVDRHDARHFQLATNGRHLRQYLCAQVCSLAGEGTLDVFHGLSAVLSVSTTVLTVHDRSLTLAQFCALSKTMLFYRAYETQHRCSSSTTVVSPEPFPHRQGHCGACKKKWKLSDSDQCSCGETQTMSHIVESCPQTRLHGGLSKLHSADDDAVAWLTSYGS